MRTWIKNLLFQNDRKKGLRNYFFVYTVLFLIVVFFVFFSFFFEGKSFIWNVDGIRQHYPALMYYGRWLRTIVKGIVFDHSFALPEWDFSIGYGSDIIATLNYYCIGDPLALLSVFVPGRYTEYLYGALCMIRLYLAGAAFSGFCFRMKKGRLATLAGAFSYVFCAYALRASIRHPYFINPMIYLPLLLIGVERIFHKEKPTLFIGMVFVSALSNFYFFYMLVLAVIFYVIARYYTFPHQNHWKEIWPWLVKFAGYGIVGVIMSAVILLPVVSLFLNGLRSTARIQYPLLYSYEYYCKIIAGLLTSDEIGPWTWLGFTGPCLLGIFLLFSQKGKKIVLKISFSIMTVFLLIPFFGSAWNGFNYVSNRWCWLYIALCSYILVSMWPDFFTMKRKNVIYVGTGGIIYLLLLFALNLNNQSTANSFAGASLMLVALVLILFQKDWGKKEGIAGRVIPCCLVCVVLGHVCVNAFYQYDPEEGDYVSEFRNRSGAYPAITETYAKVIKDEVPERDGFSRYESSSCSYEEQNADMLLQTHGTSFCWSLAKGNVSQYFVDLRFGERDFYTYAGNEKRTMPNALAGVKYFVAPSDYKGPVPYGYRVLPEERSTARGKYVIYENPYAMPLGYTYSSFIPYDVYGQMTPLERQEALMQGIVLEDQDAQKVPENIPETRPDYAAEEIEYKIVCGDNVLQQEDGSFMVGSGQSKITLEFEGAENCETYLYIKGLDISYKTKLQMYKDENQDILAKKKYRHLSFSQRFDLFYKDFVSTNMSHSVFALAIKSDTTHGGLQYRTSYFRTYTGQKDFLMNLGYQKEARKSVTITLPVRGIYRFEGLKIICQPMDNYVKQVAERKEDVLENEKIGTDEVSGTISLDEDKILCLSIPYDKGWKAYVDGEKAELFQANVMYMGIPLKAGEHSIRLVYHTYGLRIGLVISGIGFVMFGGVILFQRRRREQVATSCVERKAMDTGKK